VLSLTQVLIANLTDGALEVLDQVAPLLPHALRQELPPLLHRRSRQSFCTFAAQPLR
jgi:hypothetical protein